MEEELNYQLNLFFNPESPEKYIDVSKIKKQKFKIQDNLRIKRKLYKIENENIFNEEEIKEILNNDNKIGKEHVFATIEGICDCNRNKNAE